MRSLIGLAAILMIAALIACGGSGRASEAEYREAATIAVRDAVLVLSDLPHGWTHSDIGPAALADLQLTGECALLNARGAGFPGEVASEDSEPMTGPKGEELVSTVSAFSDVATAEAAVRQADSLVAQCKDQIGEALKRAIKVAAENMGVTDVILDIDGFIEPGTFPTLGDETLAYVLRGDIATPFGGYDVNGKILIIRDGPLTGVLIYAILRDLNPHDEESLANLLAGELDQAKESLPN
jgi:hypothetical protein